jgi:hypothetical protein
MTTDEIISELWLRYPDLRRLPAMDQNTIIAGLAFAHAAGYAEGVEKAAGVAANESIEAWDLPSAIRALSQPAATGEGDK